MRVCLGTASLFLLLWVRPAAAQDICFTQKVSFQTYIAEKSWLSVAETGKQLLSQCSQLLQAPEKANMNYYVALASLNSHDYKPAVEHAQTCTDLDAKATRCWLLLGKVYEATKDNPKANESYRKAYELTEDRSDEVSQAMRTQAGAGIWATRPVVPKQTGRKKLTQ